MKTIFSLISEMMAHAIIYIIFLVIAFAFGFIAYFFFGSVAMFYTTLGTFFTLLILFFAGHAITALKPKNH
ncbi:hypothetical protein [Campylobacter hyointestinalis]|nr:hypothetical protein [Campylobacter hyointestinalis]RAZ61544.1 hypothetical protein CHL10071_01225 [Campylobacter hyointestinalis subsp. lawsonii]PPB51403.1 hypothetical protein CDQ68_07920 [Campylobacter hyointestinalis subsp. hyointestinalis]PPB57226.1 hypothetical protein CDQ71_07440 [Campylobacter hyointestinalis subsp. hyointestinalis]PPB66998.1 hypothetical protein CDQ76_07480 [Campylobacter hyointestinalis subsp. hyointestinalis]PPB72704.1 hypothetical protein CDQ79_05995 [Campylobac